MAHSRKHRTCKGCGKDITDMGIRTQRCDPCNTVRRKEINLKFSRLHSPSQVTRDKAKPKARGIEYESQGNSEDGSNYQIYYGTMIIAIKKLCDRCGKSDEEVRGRWAPIFSDLDPWGREHKPVLYCIDCYLKECDRY